MPRSRSCFLCHFRLQHGCRKRRTYVYCTKRMNPVGKIIPIDLATATKVYDSEHSDNEKRNGTGDV